MGRNALEGWLFLGCRPFLSLAAEFVGVGR
jgi:hypothetical protein